MNKKKEKEEVKNEKPRIKRVVNIEEDEKEIKKRKGRRK